MQPMWISVDGGVVGCEVVDGSWLEAMDKLRIEEKDFRGVEVETMDAAWLVVAR